MDIVEAREEYSRALKAGQKEYKELLAADKEPHPSVLDDIMPPENIKTVLNIGMVEIPTHLIVGTKSSGRITAFTASFLPLLSLDTEFAHKWVNLCAAHLSDEGIRDPIVCFEYLGKFYIQEGNKRASVLRHFDAPRIPGIVHRVMPEKSDDPKIKTYFEFLDFYNAAGNA